MTSLKTQYRTGHVDAVNGSAPLSSDPMYLKGYESGVWQAVAEAPVLERKLSDYR